MALATPGAVSLSPLLAGVLFVVSDHVLQFLYKDSLLILLVIALIDLLCLLSLDETLHLGLYGIKLCPKVLVNLPQLKELRFEVVSGSLQSRYLSFLL